MLTLKNIWPFHFVGVLRNNNIIYFYNLSLSFPHQHITWKRKSHLHVIIQEIQRNAIATLLCKVTVCKWSGNLHNWFFSLWKQITVLLCYYASIFSIALLLLWFHALSWPWVVCLCVLIWYTRENQSLFLFCFFFSKILYVIVTLTTIW